MDSGYSTKVEENRSVSTLSETDNDENETESCDEFKQFCFSLVSSKPNWNEWILTSDISSKLTSLQLKAGRKLLWHQEETNESTW